MVLVRDMPPPVRHAAASRRAAVPAAALAALAALACGGPRKASWESVAGPQVAVEVLPRQAAVEMDGRALGAGGRSQAVRPGGRHRLRASADGFEPLEAEVEGDRVAGRTVFLVLRPQGFGSERRLEAGEPSGLAQAAARLLRAGRLDDAVEYAEQSLAAGDNALAHKVLGAGYARKGSPERSIRHYSDYLGLAPDSPDAAEVRKALGTARGDIALPAPREGRALPAR
ncbi:MAG TPA: hypothetical protein VIV59_06990 [Anaeromyxobacteraceae bacterium]